MPNLYIIADPNDAGKTTSAMVILPEVLNCLDFVNADSIAAGLSPIKPELSNLEAGKLMLSRINKKIEEGVDFAFETTLASKSFVNLIKKAQKKGYLVIIEFLYLDSYELAQERVAIRVAEGGHRIPNDIIKRRFERGLTNFFQLYINLIDDWYFYNNSGNNPELIARKNKIYNQELWHKLKN